MNIREPAQFSEKLQKVMRGTYELFELAREHELNSVEDGVYVYSEECGKTCFQVSGQYDRPSEFLQAFLDIIRANYEPDILGTFFLNSNISFLYDEIPESEFQLAYASMTSKHDQEFSIFWNDIFIPYIAQCGYDFEKATAVYAVATTGNERYDLDFMTEIATTLGSGFSVDEAVSLIASSINPEVNQPRKQVYTGYCLDSALESKVRLSLWFFIRGDEQRIYKTQ